DKFIYLFGRIIPGLSLIFSMVLRFVPKYKAQIKVISNAQKCIGRDASHGNIFKRARNGVKIISIMITWALENAIETADSMKSRGYGLKGRTSFSNYRFDNRDKIAFGIMVFFTLIVLIGAWQGRNSMQYFPNMKMVKITAFSIFEYGCYFLLCIMPIIMEVMEEIKWRHLQLEA
ncbi:MAG: energy-coupling factor transporter transmembrane component T, partial [Clostridiales bacterium]|nr:energy-coupling factor transporter transmembrane component T [Clostridiales bacterium]